MSDGVSYRLGYLSGRLRAYEREEDIKQLVMKNKKRMKPMEKSEYTDLGRNRYEFKGNNGETIIL